MIPWNIKGDFFIQIWTMYLYQSASQSCSRLKVPLRPWNNEWITMKEKTYVELYQAGISYVICAKCTLIEHTVIDALFSWSILHYRRFNFLICMYLRINNRDIKLMVCIFIDNFNFLQTNYIDTHGNDLYENKNVSAC